MYISVRQSYSENVFKLGCTLLHKHKKEIVNIYQISHYHILLLKRFGSNCDVWVKAGGFGNKADLLPKTKFE